MGGDTSGAPPVGSPTMDCTRRSLLMGAGGLAFSAGAQAATSSAILSKRGSAANVVVIGAGVFGAWTAHHLQRSGARVTLIDAHGPAHSRSSSGGESRLTRAGYGKDAIYSRMALDSLTQWQALSAISGLPILHRTGVLFFFDSDLSYMEESLKVHREIGLPTEALDAAVMAKRFPMIDFAGVRAGMFEPGFGALMARRSVQTLVQRFVASGGVHR